MNKQKGNMYGFVTHTWNAIKGVCPHDCSYCYMKRFPQKEVRLDESELSTNFGENNFIFVGSSCDMFADKIPREWIVRVLESCRRYPKNTFLFQTKNPGRFPEFYKDYPENSIFGTTIETNRENNLDKTPPRSIRLAEMSHDFLRCKRRMITIEPIMDFDVSIFVDWIKNVSPEFINIGADSKKSNLPEPSAFKIKNFIEELNKFTRINSKKNLSRLTPSSENE